MPARFMTLVDRRFSHIRSHAPRVCRSSFVCNFVSVLSYLDKAIVCLFAVFWGSAAYSQDTAPVKPTPLGNVDLFPLVTMENHGYFRFRWDTFGNGHLTGSPYSGASSSGMLPPIDLEGVAPPSSLVGSDDNDSTVVSSANIRFRWEPAFIIDEMLKISAQVDVLDNLVLGSTAAFGMTDPLHPIAFLSESQSSPSSGTNSIEDAIRIHRVWAEWTVFQLLTFEFGRMPNHWGLGMLHNGGGCLDCDYGDSVDRIAVSARVVSNIYARFAWDFPGEGAILESPRDFYGQPYDGAQADDVEQFVLEVYSQPLTREAIAERKTDLYERRVPTVDWGIRNTIRYETLASDLQGAVQGCAAGRANGVYPTLGQEYDCMVLYPRDAFYWLPDAWVRLEWHPNPELSWTIELEIAGILFGKIDRVQTLDEVDSAKEMWAGGGVLRSLLDVGDLYVGLEAGVASGDEQPYFGIKDQSNVAVADTDYLNEAGASVRNNDVVTNFKFNRGYNTDLLLFREIIGAVTNTAYVKPSIGYDLVDTDDLRIGGRLDLLYAAAAVPEGTPGNSAHLGFEADARLYFQLPPHFLGVVEGGLLIPLDGLDVDLGGSRVNAEPAWTVQGRLHLMF